MDFLALAKQRYSCRKYKEDAIPAEVMAHILEAGRVSPSAHNLQPYKVYILNEGSAALEKVRTAGKVYTAPTTLVICGDRDAAWENSYDGWKSTEVDASIITDHMMLAAADQGVSSLWMCWFDHDIVREALALPDNLVPINILLLGYPVKEPQSPDRHDERRKASADIFVTV